LSRAAGKTAAVSYFSFDPSNNQFIRGEGVDRMFGFELGEVGDIATPFFDRVHTDDLKGIYAEVERVFSAPRGDTAAFDYRVLLPNGDERFIRIRAEVATDPKDRRNKLVGSFIDLTDVEITRRALVKAVEAREALVDEANHRVKNSLQIAMGMLRIETRALANSGALSFEEAIERLNAVQSRIGAVADVHGLMQIGRETTLVSIPALLEKLVEFTRRASDLSRGMLTCSLNHVDLSVDSGVAINLGLIVNELLTNALKYSVGPEGEADVRVTLVRRDKDFTITVENGIHVASRFGDISSTNVGWRLIEQLSQQIGLRVQRESTDHRYKVELKLDHSN
jgi:two-component sensor histidine kinase